MASIAAPRRALAVVISRMLLYLVSHVLYICAQQLSALSRAPPLSMLSHLLPSSLLFRHARRMRLFLIAANIYIWRQRFSWTIIIFISMYIFCAAVLLFHLSLSIHIFSSSSSRSFLLPTTPPKTTKESRQLLFFSCCSVYHLLTHHIYNDNIYLRANKQRQLYLPYIPITTLHIHHFLLFRHKPPLIFSFICRKHLLQRIISFRRFSS